ncbi:AAA family ATPase [Streptomyces uncialis]|uniref:AAA family ATPase n=1 Tax=Streptomyces uncialis TaxID=1048205 RepID=UPI0038305EE8
MTVNRTRVTVGASGIALPGQSGAPAAKAAAERRLGAVGVVRDFRDRSGRGPRALRFAPGDLVVVSGLPGSGKTTLMARTVEDADLRGGAGAGAAGAPAAVRIDSQDTRDRWARRVPAAVPYALYRPLVRVAHFAGLRRALRSGAGVVVHDCGTQAWVRRWLAREARRRGAVLHLLLLDVAPRTALDGQRERGRGVSRYAFARHRRAVGRLVRDAERGVLPRGCMSAVLLDRAAADTLRTIAFACASGAVPAPAPVPVRVAPGLRGSPRP